MRGIVLFMLALVALAGCRTGKTATENAVEKLAKSTADSIKYAAVKDAFLNREFVFKFSRIGGTKVDPLENWVRFSDKEIWIQQTTSHMPASKLYKNGLLRKYEFTSNPKKGTVTMTVTETNKFILYLSLTLFENSDKAYGYFDEPITLVEGWIEPISNAHIIPGRETPH